MTRHFDFYMYNRVKINKSKQFGNGCSANVQSNKTPSKSNNSSFSKINSSKQSVKKKVCLKKLNKKFNRPELKFKLRY